LEKSSVLVSGLYQVSWDKKDFQGFSCYHSATSCGTYSTSSFLWLKDEKAQL
jgi:hypothetical protein